jgi:hypothetical protein
MAAGNISTIDYSVGVPNVPQGPRVPVMDQIGQGLENLGNAAASLAAHQERLQKGADVQAAADAERAVHKKLGDAYASASAADDVSFVQAGPRFAADAQKIRDGAIADVPVPERDGFTKRTDILIDDYKRRIQDGAVVRARDSTIHGLAQGLDQIAGNAALSTDPRTRAPLRAVAVARINDHVKAGWINQNEGDLALKQYDESVDRQTVLNTAKADPAGAQALLDKPDALPNLTEQDRTDLKTRVAGMAAIDQAQGAAQLESGLKQLRQSLADGQPPDPKQLGALRDLAVQAGNDPAIKAVDAVQQGVAYAKSLSLKPLPQAQAEIGALGYEARLKQIESGNNPNAVSPTGAFGVYQFTKGTAAQYGIGPGSSAAEQKEAFDKLTADNRAYLTQKLGRAPTNGELYLAHQQGAAGAVQLLSHPDDLATDVVGEQAVRVNGGGPGMTARQFAAMWINKFEKRPEPGAPPSGVAPDNAARLAFGLSQVEAMRQALASDPIGYMRATGLLDVPAIDWTNPAASFAQRASLGRTIARYNDFEHQGIAPKFFDAAETAQLGAALKAADPDSKAATIGLLAGAFGPDTPSVLGQLGDQVPVEAHLGSLYAASADREPVMKAGFWGLKALADKAVALPDNKKLAPIEAATLGAALDPRLSQTRRNIIDAAHAIYANTALRKGLSDFSPDDYAAALEAAAGRGRDRGGIIYWGPGPGRVILPLNMSEADFRATMGALTPEALVQLSAGGGAPIHVSPSGKHVPTEPDDIKEAPALISVGNGRYRPSMTDPSQGPPQYLIDAKTGGYYEMDFSKQNGPPEIEVGQKLLPEEAAAGKAKAAPVKPAVKQMSPAMDRELRGARGAAQPRLNNPPPGSLVVPGQPIDTTRANPIPEPINRAGS